MDDEIPRGVPGDPEDSIAEGGAASIDEALAAGLDAGQLSAETPMASRHSSPHTPPFKS